MGQSLSFSPPVSERSFADLMAKNWQGAVPKSSNFKNLGMTGGAAVTLLNYSGGPGVISSIFISLPLINGGSTASGNGYNGVLRCYIDGETTPSLAFDLGGPFLWFGHQSFVAWTANMMSAIWKTGTADTQLNSTLHNIFFPIPWHSSIVVTFVPVLTQAPNVYQNFCVNYVTGVDFPYKLRSSCLTYDNSVGVNGSSQYALDGTTGSGAVQFLNVQGKSGHIVFQWLCVSSAVNANASCLEQNIGLYLDGNPSATSPTQSCHSLTTIGGSPDVDSSGTEDWARTAFYGLTGQTSSSSPTNYAPSLNHPASNTLIHFTMDHLESDGGLRFETSAVLQWETGRRPINQNNTISNTAFTPFWGVLYYEYNPKP